MHPFSPAATPLLSRRGVLHVAAACALTVGADRATIAQTAATPGPVPATDNDMSPLHADQWRALSRLGYGPDAALVQDISAASSPRDWALQQLERATQAQHSAPQIHSDWPGMNASLPQLFADARREREARAARKTADAEPAHDAGAPPTLDLKTPPDDLHVIRHLVAQTAAWRLTASSDPALENALLARMTEFWFNHFNVYIGKGPVRPFVGHYLVHAIRPHALGRFQDLLLATARHPAMLFYLDQAQSVAPGSMDKQGRARGLNENYARELMELHTLGVNGGYNQNDVREMARVLTGWTVDPQSDSGFRFAARWHDRGSKTVLGQTFDRSGRMDGMLEGEQAIALLARHPSTARRISLRLARFFVADHPPESLVAQLQQAFRDTDGDMAAVMRTLIGSDAFWDQQNRLFRTPLDYACAVLTATQGAGEPHHLAMTLGFLRNAGQPLHGWPTPDGYATDAGTWLVPEALTRRADFALQLGRQSVPLEFLQPYLSAPTRSTIAREPAALRAGLALASPEFMYK